VTSEEYRKERGVYCEDIQEGKRSLMAIHSYFYGWKGDQLLAILDEKSSDESRHREAIRILELDGSIEYAKEKARLILLRAWR
jgi:geranylgeranyl pyrophosphate synthase